MVHETGSVLSDIARQAGLAFLSDEPVWYLHPETDEQKVYYGDWVLGRPENPQRITAEDLLFVAEVVTTTDRRQEIKDTGFQRVLNEYNGVPEFALVFPDVEDPRALSYYRLEDGRYVEQIIAPGGSVPIHAVEGLELRVQLQKDWAAGRKLDVLYRGALRLPLEREHERAEAEKARADRLAERLRQMGIDPDEDRT